VPLDAIELLDVDLKTVRVDELFEYKPDWGMPGPADIEAITPLMVPIGRSGFFARQRGAV
jgi:hypothetical protein